MGARSAAGRNAANSGAGWCLNPDRAGTSHQVSKCVRTIVGIDIAGVVLNFHRSVWRCAMLAAIKPCSKAVACHVFSNWDCNHYLQILT